jgi:hypothetical protein
MRAVEEPVDPSSRASRAAHLALAGLLAAAAAFAPARARAEAG